MPRLRRPRALLCFDEQRVDDAPARRHQPEPVRLDPLAGRAELLATDVDDLEVAKAGGLVRLRGDQQRAGGERPHEPQDAVAVPVDGGHEALELDHRRARALGFGSRRGPWHAALGEAIERPPDRLADGLVRRACLEPHEQCGDGRARQVAERFGEGGAVGAGEQGEHAILGCVAGDQLRGVEPETGEGLCAGGAPLRQWAAPARGKAASRDSTWSWIQCASHHSIGSTWTPWIMTLKWR